MYRGQHTATPVITGWKDLGFNPKARMLQRRHPGSERPDDRAERKTPIANSPRVGSYTYKVPTFSYETTETLVKRASSFSTSPQSAGMMFWVSAKLILSGLAITAQHLSPSV